MFHLSWSIIAPTATTSLCFFQGLGIQFSMLSAMFWTASIATHCMLAVSSNRPISQLSHYMKYYHIVSWGVPALITIATFCLQYTNLASGRPVFGNATYYCWISKDYIVFRMITFYGPLWVVFFYNLGVYIYVWRKLRMSRKQVARMTGKFLSVSISPSSSASAGISGFGALAKPLSSPVEKGHAKFIKKCCMYLGIFFINWVSFNRRYNSKKHLTKIL
jgi:hypothetical protein